MPSCTLSYVARGSGKELTFVIINKIKAKPVLEESGELIYVDEDGDELFVSDDDMDEILNLVAQNFAHRIDSLSNIAKKNTTITTTTVAATLTTTTTNGASGGEREGAALWSGTNKNRDVSTGPLARPFARGKVNF